MSRHIVQGLHVLVPGRVAYLIERNFAMDKLRQAAWGRDREMYEVAQALKAIALTWEAETTALEGPAITTTETTHRNSTDDEPVMFSTADVAKVLGDIGQPGVAKAAREGRLVGARDGRTWRFTREAVAAFAATRPRERDL